MTMTTKIRPIKRPTNRRTPPPRRIEVEPRCVGCDERVVEIHMLVDGQRLTMRSCTHCDHRGWVQNGRASTLGSVMGDMSAAHTRYRHNLNG